MKIVAIIQARMSSSRLPGKVLMALAGKPVLAHVVERLNTCRRLDEVMVATSTDASDDLIALWCAQSGVTCFRGDLLDVLDRYVQAARSCKADVVVRITADCPAIDPDIVDEVVGSFVEGGYEFYGLKGEFPDGLDCTVFASSALERAWREAHLASEREHVGPYIEKNPHLFKSGGLEKFHGLQHLRWTLDEPRDYAFLNEIFSRLYQADQPFSTADVLALLQREPALSSINADIVRNEGYLKSLKHDQQHPHVQP
jgi:spore coat polysaccharide biosynthesis protein SpsF